ncbi:MAG TPA: hypothetical protein PL029_06690, partial [Bacteroidia bacterium]|nr:hypothetical protein [Bacteroidia bacterium]
TVKSIIEANTKGEVPEDISPAVKVIEKLANIEPNFENVVGQDSLTRFDRKGKSKQGGRPGRNQNRQGAASANRPKTQSSAAGQDKPRVNQPKKTNPAKPPQNRNQNRPADKNQTQQTKRPNRPPGNGNRNNPPKT